MKLDDVLFFFMRHAETGDNKNDAYRSWSNAPEAQLTPAGRKVAEDAGKYLLAIGAPIELIIADSLDRVQESIELVARSFPEARLEFIRALHPLNMGDWTGKSKKDHPVEPFLKDTKKRIPGGDTVAEFDQRQNQIFQSIFSLIKSMRGGKVLIGGHGSNVAYLYNHVFHPGKSPVGYEGLVDPGGLIAATPGGLIPLTRVRDGKNQEKRDIIKAQEKFTLPAGHQPGMVVPEGGSSCETCEYLAEDKKHCRNEYFIAWDGGAASPPKLKGSDEIPAAANRYCSDWYEEKLDAK
ncbi:MAG: histidine phosphatase family protein [Candidatus Acidiferrales bacterium]